MLRAELLLLLPLLLLAAAPTPQAGEEDEYRVAAVPWEEGDDGAALAQLLRDTLRARGAAARAVAAPAACAAPDAPACLAAVLRALARGALHAALVPAPRAPPPPQLRDAGLAELADAGPPVHRSCYATPRGPGAPRSLLDFAAPEAAAPFALSRADLREALRPLAPDAPPDLRLFCGDGAAEEACASFATALTGDAGEAALVARLAAERGLRVRAAAVPSALLPRLRAALEPRPALVCTRAAPPPGAEPLGPPACATPPCPFEARRPLKLVNARALARSPWAARALGRVALDARELAALRAAGAAGAAAAARAHPEWVAGAGEVRAAVMIPVSSRREAFAARALRAAAELAELDAEGGAFRFKVEALDDACSGARAFKHLTDALGAEFGALSAVFGPACGGAFGAVARQSAALRLPVVAYSAQAAAGALLAAGDARDAGAAWAALLARQRWRRLAVLSEGGARAALAPLRAAAATLDHLELPDADEPQLDLIRQWAARAASAGARVLLVWAEDSRVVRAALCAGAAVGLLPAAGAVWLLPGGAGGALAAPAPCAPRALAAAADHHLSLQPAWAARWEREPDAAWSARLAARCGPACAAPPAHAALLYDALRQWDAALRRLHAARPHALDDLHRDDVVRWLATSVARAPYSGLTGAWEWEERDGGAARRDSLELRQWRDGAARAAGEWRAGELRLAPDALAWLTADGRAPDDGGERCALQALADALRSDCRVASGVASALPLAALAALLAAAAARWRRRARREYRARVAALGMRAPPRRRPDRWEVARERVVIDRELGAGAFGTVYGGHALLDERRGWTAVAVKTLRAGAGAEERLDFLSEAEAMKRLDHENVVRLLGVVTETEPVCTVMEFMLYGDLKSYLVARRGLGGEDAAPARLTALARDAARALAYLARRRCVHRDVAARNCLLSAERVLKLADFGMARLVFEHDYYRFGRKGMLPVRWMAPESLALGLFSPASDVWSFGVLLYEIVTFGALPFQGLSNAEVLARVKGGRALELPSGVRPPLARLMRSCWRRERGERPTAAALASALAASPRLLTACEDAPLDALPLALEPAAAAAARARRQQPRWRPWPPPSAAPAAPSDAPADTDAFLPRDGAPSPTHS